MNGLVVVVGVGAVLLCLGAIRGAVSILGGISLLRRRTGYILDDLHQLRMAAIKAGWKLDTPNDSWGKRL